MTIVYMDGFDVYNTGTDLNNIYQVSAATRGFFIDSGYKYGKCLRTHSDNGGVMMGLEECENYGILNSGIFGFWFLTETASPLREIFGFYNQINYLTSSFNIGIMSNESSKFAICYNVGSYSHSNLSIIKNTWYHIECSYQISNSTTMPCILKVNGIPIAEVPIGSDTLYSTVKTMCFRGTYQRWDHFYVLDFNGTTNNDFIGPYIFVTGMKPISNGSVNSWTPVPATGTNYDLVNDDTLYDSNTSVYSTVSGQQELYNLQKFTDSVDSIKGIQSDIWAGKSGLYNLKLKHLQNINSSNYSTIDSSGLGPIYRRHTKIIETNPATSQPWTTGDLGNNQFGFELWSTGV